MGPSGMPRRERLFPLEAVAPDGDVQNVRQGVDDRDADAVQAARGLIGLARELPARVQHGHDDFQRRLARMFGVGIDRNATAVVLDRQHAVGVEIDRDQFGVAGHGLVHRVVEDFGEQVVQGPLVGAADIHARAFADGLQPLQHFDRRGGIVSGHGRLGGVGLVRASIGAARALASERARECSRLRARGRSGGLFGRTGSGIVIEEEGGGGHGHTVRRFGTASGRPRRASGQAWRDVWA
jgi:hypothetical protein